MIEYEQLERDVTELMDGMCSNYGTAICEELKRDNYTIRIRITSNNSISLSDLSQCSIVILYIGPHFIAQLHYHNDKPKEGLHTQTNLPGRAALIIDKNPQITSLRQLIDDYLHYLHNEIEVESELSF